MKKFFAINLLLLSFSILAQSQGLDARGRALFAAGSEPLQSDLNQRNDWRCIYEDGDEYGTGSSVLSGQRLRFDSVNNSLVTLTAMSNVISATAIRRVISGDNVLLIEEVSVQNISEELPSESVQERSLLLPRFLTNLYVICAKKDKFESVVLELTN